MSEEGQVDIGQMAREGIRGGHDRVERSSDFSVITQTVRVLALAALTAGTAPAQCAQELMQTGQAFTEDTDHFQIVNEEFVVDEGDVNVVSELIVDGNNNISMIYGYVDQNDDWTGKLATVSGVIDAEGGITWNWPSKTVLSVNRIGDQTTINGDVFTVELDGVYTGLYKNGQKIYERLARPIEGVSKGPTDNYVYVSESGGVVERLDHETLVPEAVTTKNSEKIDEPIHLNDNEIAVTVRHGDGNSVLNKSNTVDIFKYESSTGKWKRVRTLLSTGSAIFVMDDSQYFGCWTDMPDGNTYEIWCGSIDADGDEIADRIDKCRYVYDPGQEDRDRDGIGDACEEPTATPTPSASPTVTPVATPTPSVTPSLTPTPEVTPTVSPTPDVENNHGRVWGEGATVINDKEMDLGNASEGHFILSFDNQEIYSLLNAFELLGVSDNMKSMASGETMPYNCKVDWKNGILTIQNTGSGAIQMRCNNSVTTGEGDLFTIDGGQTKIVFISQQEEKCEIPPTPIPTPTATPTSTPIPTETGNPTATPTPTVTPIVSPTATPTSTPIPTETGNPTATPTSTVTPSASPTPLATPTSTASPTVVPTVNPDPSPVPSTTSDSETDTGSQPGCGCSVQGAIGESGEMPANSELPIETAIPPALALAILAYRRKISRMRQGTHRYVVPW